MKTYSYTCYEKISYFISPEYTKSSFRIAYTYRWEKQLQQAFTIYLQFFLPSAWGYKIKILGTKKVITFFFSFIIFYLCNAVTDLQYARFMFGRYFKVYLLLDLIDWIIDQTMGNLSLVPKVVTVQWGVYSEPGLSPALCCVPFSSYS